MNQNDVLPLSHNLKFLLHVPRVTFPLLMQSLRRARYLSLHFLSSAEFDQHFCSFPSFSISSFRNGTSAGKNDWNQILNIHKTKWIFGTYIGSFFYLLIHAYMCHIWVFQDHWIQSKLIIQYNLISKPNHMA